jgi:hypothetical protein
VKHVTHADHRFNNALRYRDADHPAQTQFTPDYVLEPVRQILDGIGLDPCTTSDNPTGAVRFYAPPQDGLSLPWNADSIFVNPPYGKAREPWMLRCARAGSEGARVALLVPAATDTRIFQRTVDSASYVVFIRGRVKFGVLRPNRRQAAASHPSALLVWNADWWPVGHLGLRMSA